MFNINIGTPLENIFTQEQLDMFPQLRTKIPSGYGYCYIPETAWSPVPGKCHYTSRTRNEYCLKKTGSGLKFCSPEHTKHGEIQKRIESYPIMFVMNKTGEKKDRKQTFETELWRIDYDFLKITSTSGREMTIDEYFEEKCITRIIPPAYSAEPTVAVVKTNSKSDIETVKCIGGNIIFRYFSQNGIVNSIEGYYLVDVEEMNNVGGENYDNDKKFETMGIYCEGMKFIPMKHKMFTVSGSKTAKTFYKKKKFLNALSTLKKFGDMKLITYESLMSFGIDVKLPPVNREKNSMVTYHTMWKKTFLYSGKSSLPSYNPPETRKEIPDVKSKEEKKEEKSTSGSETQLPLPNSQTQLPFPSEPQTVCLVAPGGIGIPHKVSKTSNPERMYFIDLQLITDTQFKTVYGSADRLNSDGSVLNFRNVISEHQLYICSQFFSLAPDVGVKINPYTWHM